MSADETMIEVSFDGIVQIKASEVWPDGDAPEVITADAVRDAMRAAGSKTTVLRDWRLDDCFTVTVSVRNPHWGQDEALFPRLAPSEWDTKQVWL